MTQAQALTILKTGANIFLTGEPGAGKTHTINEYVSYLKSAKIDVAVTASTGIAATHLGGFTIHSWSGLGIKKFLNKYDLDTLTTKEYLVKRITRAKVLIIDEISMLDAPALDSINLICQTIRNSDHAFGGLQVIFVGDFFQLPPVTKNNENIQFAFTSAAWRQANPLICYLQEQHRQTDQDFLELLSSLRRNALTDQHHQHLNSRLKEPQDTAHQNLTKLFSHNEDVDAINQQELAKITGKVETFHMQTAGRDALIDQLKRGCMSPESLHLKIGAIVIFTKNSPKGYFVNGTLGEIIKFAPFTKFPVVKTKTGREVTAEPMDWNVEDNGRSLAKISQIPLRLAWALTIHKSQGTSLDAAYIDLRQAFVAGQGYVALSRVRTLSGLFLAGYNQQALQINPQVFAQDQEFLGDSASAAEEFAKFSDPEIQTLHKNFIRACGGKLPKTVKSTTAKKSRQGKNQTGEVTKAYSLEIIRAKHPNAYKPWEDQEEKALVSNFKEDKSVNEISQILGRQTGSIRSRLRKLGLIE